MILRNGEWEPSQFEDIKKRDCFYLLEGNGAPVFGDTEFYYALEDAFDLNSPDGNWGVRAEPFVRPIQKSVECHE